MQKQNTMNYPWKIRKLIVTRRSSLSSQRVQPLERHYYKTPSVGDEIKTNRRKPLSMNEHKEHVQIHYQLYLLKSFIKLD
jgi:hypothetical protein